MKRLHALPTDDIILQCLANNTLGRNDDVARFCSILDSFHECTVIALDGVWGSGKTFFVKQSKMLLDYYCENPCLNSTIVEGCERAKSMDNSPYKDLVVTQKHSTVYYDAWENDDDSDPILSIINAVIKTEQVVYRIKNDRSAIDILKNLADCVTGRSISALCDAIQGEDFLVDIKRHETINELMRKFIDRAVGKENERLVIFVDELDRCKPTFAVSLLERVKHFFTDSRLTFVFSINQDQLQHTIKSYYGNGMNGSKYLEKLFDISLPLPEANIQQYMNHLGFQESSFHFDKIYWAVIRYFQFGLRDTAKFLQYLKLTTFDLAHRKIYGNNTINSNLFCLIYVTPVLTGLRLHDISKFNDFIEGKSGTPLLEILSSSGIDFTCVEGLLGNKEHFKGASAKSSVGNNEIVIEVDLNKRLTDIYEAIFKNIYTNHELVKIGYLSFDEDLKKYLLKLISPLSEYADTES